MQLARVDEVIQKIEEIDVVLESKLTERHGPVEQRDEIDLLKHRRCFLIVKLGHLFDGKNTEFTVDE